MDFPLAGVAVVLSVRAGALAELRVALSGTNSNPFELDGTGAFVGQRVDDAMLAALDKLVQKQVRPMRSTVTHSNYRRQVASVLAQRLVRELAGAV
jgi:4-hydroxybenzoyl-CoA reductase subunit beta